MQGCASGLYVEACAMFYVVIWDVKMATQPHKNK